MPDQKSLLEAAQTLARKNNENAAVNHAYRQRRRLRRKLKTKSRLSKKALAAHDWQAAECEARPVRAVGFFMPDQPVPFSHSDKFVCPLRSQVCSSSAQRAPASFGLRPWLRHAFSASRLRQVSCLSVVRQGGPFFIDRYNRSIVWYNHTL
jgi:hypothetical protein